MRSANDYELQLRAFERMCLIRRFEQAAYDLSIEKEPSIAGSVHLCAGQEAVPVGAALALEEEDQVIATYRGHGWALECGVSVEGLMAELLHKSTGVNGGRSGSALVTFPNHRFIGENSIVGAGGPIACGVALAARLNDIDAVTVVSFGDGATSQGALHESLVFAASRSLPVVFVCENNSWSEMTPTSRILKTKRIAGRAAGYGFKGATIDGTDPIAVRDTVAMAREELVRGNGPVLLECTVPRLWGHYNRDIEHYRPKADREDASGRDPILRLEEALVAKGLSSADELDLIRKRVDKQIEAAVAFAKESATPDPSTARLHVIGAIEWPKVVPPGSAEVSTKEMAYIEAVNAALRAELETRDDVIVFGEDVGHAGGIFGATRYLQRDFGEERVFDTPIAEAAILGSAVGAAISGKRPVVEIMWADFLLVALDQIINQAANIRYLTRGEKTVPLVVRVQQGATPGSTAQHSQCLEALLSHIPGLRVGLPATPQDAYSMLRAAVASEDPTIIIESRSLYRDKGPVALAAPIEPTAGSVRRRDGTDICLVTWGSTLPAVMAAADELTQDGVSAAVLDLRWLSPLDLDQICEAVSECGGKVVVVHEANLTGGFGAEIVTRLLERLPEGIAFRRVATPDVRIPASPVLQSALLPNSAAIRSAALELVVERPRKTRAR
ncbi:transketolase [Bosea sp. WAO]|uniref:alpha-ketoacid dehydrogenase subunit alpha/beta n=1 Tax=Bosea sp. WAO TaxID=406341 RepID=UPI0007499CBF|nr:alpha-ketoacid dehydrogenase subunit alpha/beta [Bosea sp. WAO]KUL96475.1 transketolase [Bosea sp. WAO]